jgi:hypothetical protein
MFGLAEKKGKALEEFKTKTTCGIWDEDVIDSGLIFCYIVSSGGKDPCV